MGFMDGESFDPATDQYDEYGNPIPKKKHPRLIAHEAQKHGTLSAAKPGGAMDWGDIKRKEAEFWFSAGEPGKAISSMLEAPPKDIIADFLPMDAGTVGMIKRGKEAMLLARKAANANKDPFEQVPYNEYIDEFNKREMEQEATLRQFREELEAENIDIPPIPDNYNVTDFTELHPELYVKPNRIDEQVEEHMKIYNFSDLTPEEIEGIRGQIRREIEYSDRPDQQWEEIFRPKTVDEYAEKIYKERGVFGEERKALLETYLNRVRKGEDFNDVGMEWHDKYQMTPPEAWQFDDALLESTRPKLVVDNTKKPEGEPNAIPYLSDWNFAKIVESTTEDAKDAFIVRHIKDADGGIAAVDEPGEVSLRSWGDLRYVNDKFYDPDNRQMFRHEDIRLMPFKPYNKTEWDQLYEQTLDRLILAGYKGKGQNPVEVQARNLVMFNHQIMPPDPTYPNSRYYYVRDDQFPSQKNIAVVNLDSNVPAHIQIQSKLEQVLEFRPQELEPDELIVYPRRHPQTAEALAEKYGLQGLTGVDLDSLMTADMQFEIMGDILGLQGFDKKALGLGGRLEMYSELPMKGVGGVVWSGPEIKMVTQNRQAFAHEWAHALDNYLSSTFGNDGIPGWTVQETLEKTQGRPYNEFNMDETGKMQDLFLLGARPELRLAWAKVQRELDIFRKEFDEVHKFHGEEAYVGNRKELFARALDQYFYSKGLEKGYDHQLLSKMFSDVVNRRQWTDKAIAEGKTFGTKHGQYIYTTPTSNREEMRAALDNLFSTMKTVDVKLKDGRTIPFLYALPMLVAGGAAASMVMTADEARAQGAIDYLDDSDVLLSDPRLVSPPGQEPNDARMLELWSKYYHTEDDPLHESSFLMSNFDIVSPRDKEAIEHIDNAIVATSHMLNGNPDFLARLLFMTYKHESAGGKFVKNNQSSASGWWQVTATTAKDILTRTEMWDDEVARFTGYGREQLAGLSKKQLASLLQKDQQLDAVFAALVYIDATKRRGERLE